MTTDNNQHKKEEGGDMVAAKARGQGMQQPSINGSGKGQQLLELRAK